MLLQFVRAAALAVALSAAGHAQDAADLKAAENARVQQYVQALQPALWKELDFIRHVCDIPPEQRPKIKAAGDAAVKEAAQAMVPPQRQPRMLPIAGAHLIREAISTAVVSTLSPQQISQFSAESEKRAAACKEATVLGTVALLEGTLYLTPEQRAKIAAALSEHWQPDWEQWLMIHRYAGQHVPQVPDQYVEPHLNAEQRALWGSLHKIALNHWGGGSRRPEDEAWWQGKSDDGPDAKSPPANDPSAP